jgi:hypothetical protein
LARWRSPLCPLVKGPSRDNDEYLLTKLSDLARAVGVPLGGEKCRPNFYVVMTPDPDAFLTAWSKRDKNMFGDGSSAKIAQFMHSSDPIRSWYNVVMATADGSAIASSSPAMGNGTNTSAGAVPSANAGGPFNGVSSNNHADATRISFNEIRTMHSVAIVVDTHKTEGVKYDQLAAYIAMVGFAEVRRNPDLASIPTVLTLFDKDAKSTPPGLSEWDEALLKGLYQTEQSGKTQAAQIRLFVARTVTH